jgi:lysophospholipase L1-like esterase
MSYDFIGSSKFMNFVKFSILRVSLGLSSKVLNLQTVEISLNMKNETVKYEVPSIVTILFQGDSITEACRDRTKDADMGTGYVKMVANRFSTEYAGKRVRFLNRGVGGDRVRDLKNRWQKDCLNLEPEIVSILIGINDTVGKYFWNKPTSTKSFEEDYRIILEQTHDILGAKIVLLTPFIVYMTKLQLINKIVLKQKIGAVKKLSKEFQTLLIPLDRIFDEATRKRAATYWSTDGIHPTQMGHSLIAQSWLKSVSAILR